MKFSIKHILSTVALSLIGLVANSQAPNSLYFLNNPQSHYLNPALTTDKGWVTLPLGGYFTINSDLGLGSFMTPYGDDKMRLFTHPEISVKDAMSKFKDINSLEFETATNLLTVGFNAWGGTNSIGLSMKMHGGFYIPKDIFRFLKEGQEADGDTEYKLDKFGGRMQAYSEIALGHARDINKKLTIGAKVKLILGLAYANANIDNMRIHMTDKEWNIEHNTSIVTSQALDLRTNNDVNLDNLRYDKICILADADSDGLHIGTLICALFTKHYPEIVKAGHLYVAMPPLYRIDSGLEKYYALDEEEREAIIAKILNRRKNAKYEVTRFKGLGEMDKEQLKETTMNPATRRLVQLTLSEDSQEETYQLMDMLLSKKRAGDRREWLEEKGNLADIED